jgi:PAS domain S-box-containing protein
VKRALTLRGTLRLLGLGAMGYVAIIAVVIAVRLGPTAIALRRYSERMLEGYNGMRVRTLAFHATIDDIHPLLIAVARGAARDPLRPRLAALRARVDSLSAVASGVPAIATIPNEMRIEFAAGSVEQSQLEVALTDALANLELGRAAVAVRRLEAADSIAGLLDRHVAEAQRLGLVDLIRRESALADATTVSLRAIGWWLGLGIVVAPFFVVFLRRRFYDPLSELDRALVRVAHGDLEGMIPVLRQDELGRLSGHFNETTAMLRRRAEETRRHAQAALRESEERYEAIVEFAPLGIAVVDAAGRYVHVNPALERFLGYTEAELRTMRFSDVTVPDDVHLTAGLFKEMVDRVRDRFQIEKRYVRKDGTVVWGRLLVAAVRDDTGALIHTVSLTEDVTEEKRRDAAARQVEERLRHEQAALVDLARHEAFTTGDVHAAWRELTQAAARTLDVARVGIWLLDADRPTLRCDDLYDAGRDRHSAGTELAAERFPSYFAALHEDRVIAAADARTEPRTSELSAAYLVPLGITSILDAPIRVGGRVAGVVCHEHIGPPRDWSAAAQSFAGSIADLAALALEAAERARAELARRKSEETFAIAFRLNPNPSVIARLTDGLLVDANDAYFEATGFTRAEVIGKAARDVLWPVPEGRDAMVRELEQHGRLRHMDLKMRTKSGPLLDVLVSVDIIEIDGVRHTLGAAIDVTERNRVAAALRDSEERYRNLVESSPDAISVVQDGVVRYVNAASVKLMGVRGPEDVIGRSPYDFVAEESLPEAARRLDGILRGEPDRLGELRLRRPDGSFVAVEALGIRLEFGGRPAVLVIQRDVTSRHQAEEQLRLLGQAVTSTSEGISITDLEGRFTFANPAFLDALGYAEEEILGQPVAMINSPRNPPVLQEELRAATAHGGWTGELYNRRKDGTDFLLALTTAPVKDATGRTVALMGVSSDITERRRADEEQRRLREAVMASAVDWTLTFDAVESPILILDGAGRVRRLNAAARTLAGNASYQEAMGLSPSELGDGEPWAGLADVAAEVVRRQAPATSQVFEQGARRSWYLTASPFTVSGEEDRVIVIARDVTDLVALQESLRRTETMSALGSLVAGVAHEVRNPLFAISATVDAFEARFGQQESYARYTTTLRQEVSRLSELMRGLLEYGKPPRLELSDTAIQPIVTGAIERCAALAEPAGVQVTAELERDLPVLRLDASRMLQVFQNLIENAVQHSPRGSIVTVRAAATSTPSRPGVDVTVTDHGPGFRPEDLPHIFEPFFTRRRGGTGLGLSIVERILEQHGGDVTAANRDGGGAIMTVHLYAAPPSPRFPTPVPGAVRVQA